MKVFQIYILICADESYYVGMTSDLEKRMTRHDNGFYENSYTSSRRPVRLVFNQKCRNFKTTMLLEKQIKKWSRAKKEALISGEFELLPELSKKKF